MLNDIKQNLGDKGVPFRLNTWNLWDSVLNLESLQKGACCLVIFGFFFFIFFLPSCEQISVGLLKTKKEVSLKLLTEPHFPEFVQDQISNQV